MSRRPRRARAAKAAGRTRRLPILPLGIVVILALAASWGLWAYAGPGPTAARGASTEVVLAPGAGLPGIARTLSRAGVIRSGFLFIVAAQLTGAARHLKAGDYDFVSGAPMAKVLAAIRDGAVIRRYVTVPEGVTSNVAADILRGADYLSGAVEAPPEGAILPETYEVQRGESRAIVLGRMMEARDALLATLWRGRREGLPYLSPEQAVTLASVVEKETAKADERPRIAAAFVNRLRKGMRLESDPTVIYGLTGGEPLGHGLRASELASPSPYNTYLVAGLPPTPIANPGRASLVAALNPSPTADLYFVADGAGGHVFADTFEAHQRNVARWRAIEQPRPEQAKLGQARVGRARVGQARAGVQAP